MGAAGQVGSPSTSSALCVAAVHPESDRATHWMVSSMQSVSLILPFEVKLYYLTNCYRYSASLETQHRPCSLLQSVLGDARLKRRMGLLGAVQGSQRNGRRSLMMSVRLTILSLEDALLVQALTLFSCDSDPRP